MTQTILDSQQLPAFREITYTGQTQVNYLNDIAAIGPQHVLFLESLNYNETSQNKERTSRFDSIPDELYKKIVKQGYVERPSKVSRKSKKGDSQVNYYNSNDSFINDDDCCIEKKDKFSTYQDYKSVAVSSLEELYKSEAYSQKMEEFVVDLGKRKVPEQFMMVEEGDFEKFDQMKKQIRNSILNRNIKLTEAQIVDKPNEQVSKLPQNQTTPVIIRENQPTDLTKLEPTPANNQDPNLKPNS